MREKKKDRKIEKERRREGEKGRKNFFRKKTENRIFILSF